MSVDFKLLRISKPKLLNIANNIFVERTKQTPSHHHKTVRAVYFEVEKMKCSGAHWTSGEFYICALIIGPTCPAIRRCSKPFCFELWDAVSFPVTNSVVAVEVPYHIVETINPVPMTGSWRTAFLYFVHQLSRDDTLYLCLWTLIVFSLMMEKMTTVRVKSVILILLFIFMNCLRKSSHG